MIDLRLVRDQPDRVRASQRARGADESVVDELLAADDARRAAVLAADNLRAEQNVVSKSVRSAAADERPALIVAAKQLAEQVKAAEVEQAAADAALRAAQLSIANVIEDGVPPGGEDDFVTLELVGTPPEVADPRDHTEIGAALAAIDTERGAKVSGARFYFLTGIGAQLELALVQLAMEQATAAGFIPIIAPALVKPEIMEGTGFLGAHADEVYRLANDDLYLVGTSEVALAGFHSNEILEPASLPLRYAGFSSCFRREAGSYGKDTKGIIRVHWFDKVEMFVYTSVDDAADEHQRLLAWEREFMDKLELAYRVIDVAAGDLGSSAARKYDIEAWFPSQGTYRELTSTSNCTTFQARRLNIRTRGEGATTPVATLNGTLCAVARTIACLLDHHQQPDGSVYVPLALRPWLGGRELLVPPDLVSTYRSAQASHVGDLSGVRLLATDLDGTLIRTDHTVADETRSALRRATDAGLLVVFVTGRPPRWLDEITDVTDHTGIAVTANGAALYDLQSTTILHSFELSPAELVTITADIRAAYPEVYFGVEYGRNFGHEPGYAHDWQINPSQDRSGRALSPPIVGDLAQLLTQPATKLLARDRQADSDQFQRDVEEMLIGRATVTHSSGNGLIEIAARGVTKASGLALVAREHGISPAEVAAVGDMPNDLPMLAWAGHSFAVANAHPAVLDAAGTVLGTNDEHAVALLVDAILAARAT